VEQLLVAGLVVWLLVVPNRKCVGAAIKRERLLAASTPAGQQQTQNTTVKMLPCERR
jgi:hypothetical protein